jgi:hypothetical protein
MDYISNDDDFWYGKADSIGNNNANSNPSN